MEHKNTIIDDQVLDKQELEQDIQDNEIVSQTGPMRPESRRDLRSLAFHLIYAIDRYDYTISLEELVESYREGFELDVEDDSPAIIMAHGAITSRAELDEEIKPLLKNWKLERLGCCTKLILRLALWELHQPGAVPNIVINEAIELAKAFAEKDAYKFINGILDEACKKLELTISQEPIQEGDHEDESCTDAKKSGDTKK